MPSLLLVAFDNECVRTCVARAWWQRGRALNIDRVLNRCDVKTNLVAEGELAATVVLAGDVGVENGWGDAIKPVRNSRV